MVQLSTAMREWTSLLLLHYCVYDPLTDKRSLRWNPPIQDSPIITTRPPPSSDTLRKQLSSSWSAGQSSSSSSASPTYTSTSNSFESIDVITSTSSYSPSSSSSIASTTPLTSTKQSKAKQSKQPIGFIQQFIAEIRTNTCARLINRTVNDRFLSDIYPPEFNSFRLPLNPLLSEIVYTTPNRYRNIYAGEDMNLVNDMNQNPNSLLVSGTSPQSPLQGQFPWASCSPVFVDHLRTHFNRSQLFAIEASLYLTQKQTPSARPVSGLTLIQGPPGTGKTRTLLTLLNVLQNQQFNLYYEQLRQYVNNILFAKKTTFLISLDSLNKARIQMKETLKRPRILVCTPSNAAVNTIIDGIMMNGFIDNSGKRYNPSILRLGSGTSRDHWSVSLEYMVEVRFFEITVILLS